MSRKYTPMHTVVLQTIIQCGLLSAISLVSFHHHLGHQSQVTFNTAFCFIHIITYKLQTASLHHLIIQTIMSLTVNILFCHIYVWLLFHSCNCQQLSVKLHFTQRFMLSSSNPPLDALLIYSLLPQIRMKLQQVTIGCTLRNPFVTISADKDESCKCCYRGFTVISFAHWAKLASNNILFGHINNCIWVKQPMRHSWNFIFSSF